MQSDGGDKPGSWKLQYSLMSAIMGGIGTRDVQTGESAVVGENFRRK